MGRQIVSPGDLEFALQARVEEIRAERAAHVTRGRSSTRGQGSSLLRRLAVVGTSAAMLSGIVVTSAVAAHVDPGAPTTTHNVQPIGVHGNPNCAGLSAAEFELRNPNAAGGTLGPDANGFSVTTTIVTLPLGQGFNFEATGGIVMDVFVKGGPNGNWYPYSPDGVTSDTGLHAPVNPGNGRYYGLSHISYCYNSQPTPTLATTLTEVGSDPLNSGASISVAIGASVFDSATLSGATADAGGTITYAVYSDDACTILVEDLTPDPDDVVNGLVPDSETYVTDTVDTFYFQAKYFGDANNADATSVCTDEVLTVTKTDPTLATTLTEVGSDPLNNGASISVSIGASVFDSATLSGATADAGGTITYAVYSDDACTILVEDLTPDPDDVVNGLVPDSETYVTDTVDTFYFQAKYFGDANNADATSLCTDEVLTVTKNQPDLATQPWVIPQDDATLSDLLDVADWGDITFELWDNATCDGNLVYSETFEITGNDTFPTSNSGDPTTVNPGFAITSDGTFYWVVSYSGDDLNEAVSSECGDEVVDVDLTPDPAPAP